jgi:hypothetical protein
MGDGRKERKERESIKARKARADKRNGTYCEPP